MTNGLKQTTSFFGFIAVLVACAAVTEEISPEAAIYRDNCAGCHDAPATKAPTLAALRQMRPEYLYNVLTEGRMQAHGDALETDERTQLIGWLTRGQKDETGWVERFACQDQSVNLSGNRGEVTGVGYGAGSLRHQPRSAIGHRTVRRLELDRVMAFPGATEMRSQPALIGDTLFQAVAETNELFALDAQDLCVKWVFKAKEPLRSGVGYGKVREQDILFVGAGKSLYVVDPLSGKEIWSHSSHFFSLHTAQPVLAGDTLLAAESSWEMFAANDPNYECCKVSGSVTAYDALTGEIKWRKATTPPAQPQGKSSVGTQMWGPSGAPIWGTPTVDEKRGLVYVGTGQNYTRPATDTSDAILALDIATGEIRWKFQGTADDVYNDACKHIVGKPNLPSCPDNPGPDMDFGASVMIVTDDGGRELLIAGQKSGMVYALDPDDGGKLVWETRLSDGSFMGGVHWNMSAMGGRIFAPVSDPNLDIAITDPALGGKSYEARPGLVALDAATGNILWRYSVPADCVYSVVGAIQAQATKDISDCANANGFSAGVTTVSGLVFSASIDGVVRAHDARNGKVLWQAETNRSFVSANGPMAHGGAIDNNTLVVRGDRLYVQSGYGQFIAQLPGNVLLVYKIKR